MKCTVKTLAQSETIPARVEIPVCVETPSRMGKGIVTISACNLAANRTCISKRAWKEKICNALGEVGNLPDKEWEIERELEELRASFDTHSFDADSFDTDAEEFEAFDDWYAQLRRQYGKPSDDALAFLREGDFAAFEQMVRDGYEPPLH